MARFGKLLSFRRVQRVITLSPKHYVLCERQQKHWQLTHVLIGTFGNYMIGIPCELAGFSQFLKGIGGIKTTLVLFPNPDLAQKAYDLFVFTGTQTLKDPSPLDWPVPFASLLEGTYPDFTPQLKGQGEVLTWEFSFRDQLFSIGPLSSKGQKLFYECEGALMRSKLIQ